MKLILHNLRKDARRLWLPLLVSLALLAALAHDDRWRSDFTPGPLEGWLNVFLPLAWAFIVALVIHEEALTGDREFWLTRPYRRFPLFTEKALFLLLAIHVPLFVADCAILMTRGFNPFDAFPQLFWKQMVVAFCVTLPAAALAAAVDNIAQFLLGALLAATTVAVTSGILDRFRSPLVPTDEALNAFAMAPIVAGAAAVVAIQYARRRTRLSRRIGIGAVLAAVLVFALTPRAITAVVACANRGVSVRIRPGPPDAAENRRRFGGLPNGVVVGIPLEISGLPTRSNTSFEQLSLDIYGPNGERFRASTMSAYVRAGEKPMLTATFGGEQVIWIHNSVWSRLRTGRVTIEGRAVATVHRHGEGAWLPVEATGQVNDIGRCYSAYYDDRMDQSGLKVVCESPARLPLGSGIRVWDPVSGRDWKSGMRAAYTFPTSIYPRTTWLSPLWREQAYFQVTPKDSHLPGDRWLIPRDALVRAQIEITPLLDAGCTSLHYELRDVALANYILPPR